MGGRACRFARLVQSIGWIVTIAGGFNAVGFASEAAGPFVDAVAHWDFPEISEAPPYEVAGAVTLNVPLEGWESAASSRRGGSGVAGNFCGGYLNAGQGDGHCLNITGQALTLFARIKATGGEWGCGIVSKHGGHDALLYNLFATDFGSGMEMGFELGIDGEEGCRQVRTPIPSPKAAVWRNVVVVYDGASLKLFMDGSLRVAKDVTGSLRTGNQAPCLIGTDAEGGPTFKGLIDVVALWKRALSEQEVMQLCRITHEEAVAMANQSVEEARALAAADPYRPGCHLMTASRFINDPNGPVLFEGRYHMFFQHLPYYLTDYATGPGWGHAVSRDMVFWENLPIALMPTPGSYDDAACASGACVVNDDGVPTIVYTSVPPQAQSLAMSTDGMLTWTKYEGNPVIPGRPDVENLEEGFRDPFVWKDGEWWFMVVGSGIKDTGGTVLLYRSRDLIDWEFLNPLCVDMGDQCNQWECPNFFKLGDQYVLIVSPLFKNLQYLRGDVQYAVGSFKDFKFEHGPWRRMDWGSPNGHFYAPNSMLDAKGRRILWGWTSFGSSAESPWNGMLTLPRVLTLRDDGRLGMEPLPELAALRTKHWNYRDLSVEGEKIFDDIPSNQLEILMEIDPAGAQTVGLDVLGNEDFSKSIRFSFEPAQGKMHLNEQSGDFTLEENEDTLVLHMFVDRSVAEVFVNKRECVTVRAFPPVEARRMRLFAQGESMRVKSLDVWALKDIWSAPRQGQ